MRKNKSGEVNLESEVESFREELKLVKVNSKSKFILFGDCARELYDNHFEKYFLDNNVFYLNYYSGRGADKTWVENVWKRLDINDLKYKSERKKYR